MYDERELAVDPAFFHRLKGLFPRITSVQVVPKRGEPDNEMVSFRYDVIVRTEAETVDELGRMVVGRIQLIDGITRTVTCPVVNL